MTDAATPPPTPAPRTNARGPLWLLVVGGLLIIGLAALLVHQLGQRDGVDHRYEIPSGTAAALDEGQAVAIVPAELHLAPHDRLTITNDDDRRHEIGVFSVDPGQTVSYTFPNKGTFIGACTLHSGGGVTIYVG